jgi:hypothetical protein
VTIAVNGVIPIPRIEQPGYLADLQESGVRYIFSRRALGDPLSAQGAESAAILASKPNLFVFRTSAADAEIIAKALNDSPLSPGDMRMPEHKSAVENYMDDEKSPIKKMLIRFLHLRAVLRFLRRR